MKALIAALLLTVGSAHAQVWSMPNRAGGEIILTTKDCTVLGKTYTTLKTGYAYAASGNRLEMCWWIEDGLVHAYWLSGSLENTRSTWKIEDFSRKDVNAGSGGSV